MIDKKNPDILLMNGVSKDKKHTFSMQFNRKTKQYIYQGGIPEKIYSNNPDLNREEFPRGMDSFMRRNLHNAITTAQIKGQFLNGINFIDNDKKIHMSLIEGTENIDIKIYDKEGKRSKRFVMNPDSKEYIATDLQTGEMYSNIPEYQKKGLKSLPDNILKMQLRRYEKAKNIARTNIVRSIDTQRQ